VVRRQPRASRLEALINALVAVADHLDGDQRPVAAREVGRGVRARRSYAHDELRRRAVEARTGEIEAGVAVAVEVASSEMVCSSRSMSAAVNVTVAVRTWPG
jgi:hypothetical protein